MTLDCVCCLRAGLISALVGCVALVGACVPHEREPAAPTTGEDVQIGELSAPPSGDPVPVEEPVGGPLIESNPRFSDQVRTFEASGEIVWADGYEGELIAGLDGSEYPPYTIPAIERIQSLLRTRGLYAGPTNGVLDLPTMEAIAEFQKATQTLQVCGIPTPRTRQLLQQGSHTI